MNNATLANLEAALVQAQEAAAQAKNQTAAAKRVDAAQKRVTKAKAILEHRAAYSHSSFLNGQYETIETDGWQMFFGTYSRDKNQLVYKIYRGNQSKVLKFCRTNSREDAIDALKKIVGMYGGAGATKEARAAARNQPHTLKVGDVLYSSWGYSMTLVDFYVVVEVPSPNTAVIQEIASTVVTGSAGYTGTVVASNPPVLVGEAMRVRVNGQHNSVKINSSSTAYPYNGQELSFNNMD